MEAGYQSNSDNLVELIFVFVNKFLRKSLLDEAIQRKIDSNLIVVPGLYHGARAPTDAHSTVRSVGESIPILFSVRSMASWGFFDFSDVLDRWTCA